MEVLPNAPKLFPDVRKNMQSKASKPAITEPLRMPPINPIKPALKPKQAVKPPKNAIPGRQRTLSKQDAAMERFERIGSGWKKFKKLNTKHWVVAWNSRTGLPYKILGNKTHPFPGDVKEVGMAFLLENKDLFLLNDDLSGLTIKEQNEGAEKSVITFYQTYNGMPVFDSEISIHTVTADSESKPKAPIRGRMKKVPEPPKVNKKSVFMVLCTLYPVLGDKIEKDGIGRTQAANIARKAFERGHKKTKIAGTEKVIYHTRKRVYRAWKVLFLEEELEYRFLVDAHKGVILLRDSIVK